MPLFGDLARLLGQQGPIAWDAARQLAVSIATEGRSEPNVEPVERIRLEQLARVAELHVTGATGLTTAPGGRPAAVEPVTRGEWVLRTTDAFRPLFERLATSLGAASTATGAPPLQNLPDQLSGADDEAVEEWLSGLLSMLSPMLLGMTAGSMIGHLSRTSFGLYDLPIPRPPDAPLLLVPATIDAFGTDWSLDGDDLRLWVLLRELTTHAVFGVSHVRARLTSLLADYAAGFSTDPSSLERRMADLDLSNPGSLMEFQKMMGDPEILLGAVRSPAQDALLPQIEAVVAVVLGYVDHVMDRIGTSLIASYGMVTEAMRRRRVESTDADRFVERLFGLELTQARVERATAFVDGVVERAGAGSLDRLWSDELNLPTPAEVDAPGLWLERIDLPRTEG
jgi:putative hydrolase